jgi:crotonobetainyl-CoA:carnitine CoA-transferase CaiB-like acyl-CoA transferase
VLLGSGVAISTFGSVLADQGADVVRVEPPTGDPGRLEPPLVDGASLAWAVAARSCRSVTCDPENAEGRALVLRLLSRADLVGDGMGPGRMEQLGLWPGAFKGPRALVRFSGYGQYGPYADRQAPELVALASGGMLALTGHPTGAPVAFGVRLAEQLTGLSGATAALAAALDPTPDSDWPVPVDIATYAAVLRITEWTVAAWDRLGVERQREGNRPSTVAPLDVYRSADGDHVAIVGGSDANFGRLVQAMDRPDLVEDQRYATPDSRVAARHQINDIVADWVSSLSTAEVERRCLEAGAPFGRVAGPQDLLTNPHFTARGDLVTVEDPVVGPHRQQAPHPRFSGYADALPAPAPALGQHNEAVWCNEVGVGRQDFVRFKDQGVI